MTFLLVATVVLTVLSAVLAWFALTRVPPPTALVEPDVAAWRSLGQQFDLDARLDGPVQTWVLDGDALRAWVVEVDGQRWTRVGRRLAPGEAAAEGPPPEGPFVEDGWLVATVVGTAAPTVRAWLERLSDGSAG